MLLNSGFTRRAFSQWLGKAGLAAGAILNGCVNRMISRPAPKIDCEPSSVSDGEYDYIIVGSGAGGGPLAANLARKGHNVLLMEAGGEDENDHYQVPVFHTLASEDPVFRWDFFVQHYSDVKKAHKDPKYSELNRGIFYPRSGTLGGCTAHNAMITLYPHNSDWDYIAQLTGDTSWRHENMQQYFERLENCQYVEAPDSANNNPSRHGFNGWLSTSIPGKDVVLDGLKDRQLRKVLKQSIKESLKQKIGTPFRRLGFDPNDWRNIKRSAEGLCKLPLSTYKGRRVGSREYIKAVQQACGDRLTVKLNSLVTRVLLDDGNNAIGVEYRQGQRLYHANRDQKPTSEGSNDQVFARREVILAGGAFNTPQLLMLSGVGPKEALSKQGIAVKLDLPGVGKNLQDRYEISVITQMQKDFSMLQDAPFKSPEQGSPPDPFYADWQQGKGIYTTNGVSLSFIKRSNPKQPEPDLFVFGMPGYFAGYYPGYSEKTTKYQDYFTWAILKAHTQNNAGTVTLKSADPLDTPEINFRYFDEGNDAAEDDLNSVVAGIRFVRKINDRSKNFIRKEVLPGQGVESDEQLASFVKANAWGHHASCSCKMGSANDPMSVVDSDFKVKGIGNLRIVDASVFPRIPGFFIVSAIYMISEKAASVIHDASLQKLE